MNSVKIGTYQMDTAFGLYLPEYTIPAPAPQTKFVKIIGRDGSVDLSDAIGLHYDSRSWSLDFKCFDPTVNWHTLTSSVMNAIHGKRLNFEFDDDPDYFWTGRISVSSYVSTRGTGTLKVNITSDPFKYAKLSTIVTKTASTGTEYTGSMVTFTNGLIYDLSADIEPIQDLHGYANPWPGGGWENILPMPITSGAYANRVTVAVNPDLSFVINKSSGSGWTQFQLGSFSLDAGTYTLIEADDGSSNASISIFHADGTEITNTRYSKRRIFTLSSAETVSATYSRAASATDVLTKIMLFAGDAKTSDDYSPYSNICPISGLTGLSVYRTGKNMFDEAWEIGAISTTTGESVPSNASIRTANYIPLVGGQSYYWSWQSQQSLYMLLFTYKKDKTFSRYVGAVTAQREITINSDEAFIRFYIYNNTTEPDWMQISKGSTTSQYEPYNGNTYSVDWSTQAGTVYGGTVDVVSGELTVDMVNIPSYNGETINEPWLSSMDAYAAGTTPTIGAQVVYTLATPVTYQLGAQNIEALVGTNNIWTSAGNVSVTVVTPETVTNDGNPAVPTVTASADMVLRWGNYSASVQQGTSTIPQLVLDTGDNEICIIGTGNISFEWSEASL